jgi:4-amino-4-deoxy-L-arabinose transferase-like glycosyltransferase
MLPPLRMPYPARKQRLIGTGIGLACMFGVFLLMANDGQLPHATLLGFALMLGTIFGLCKALGIIEPPSDAIRLQDTSLYPLPGESRWAAPLYTAPAAITVLLAISIAFGAGHLPIAISAALLILFVSALRRPGLLVFVVASAIYLPLLGSYGLWDPWETHYGEVSREILSRDDWISLWWAQDQWFWSKPILIFWSEALTWSGTGIGFHPDMNPAHTAWILRLPVYLQSVLGLLAVYAAMAKLWSKRAAVLSCVVLATTPYYAFLTHQAITDMPFVANMTVAMMLLCLAFAEDPEREAKWLRIGRFGVSMQHAVIALIVGIALPQLLYLASRNITFIHGLFAWHRDVFLFGSGGNPNVPGNLALHEERPMVFSIWFEPLAQAWMFGLGLIALLYALRGERRAQPLYMFAFYAFCALAFMAKGIPGFALPGLVACLYLWASGRFNLLFEGRLRVAAGVLVVIALGMPWFIAMYVRHGSAFTDRILIHDHINRLTSGVHGDNGSIQYFIWQLGYGMFPWIGFLPAGLASWLVADRVVANDAAERARRDTLILLGLWFAASFTLFSAMTTKFHHYIFPAVPPAALLIGVLLDRMLPRDSFALGRAGIARSIAALTAPLFLSVGVAGLRGDVRGVMPASVPIAERARWVLEHPWPLTAALSVLALGLALFAYAARSSGSTDQTTPRANLAFGSAAVAGAVLLAFVGRDLSWHTRELPPGSERLIHLFVYNYGRPWPDYLDYRPIFFGFACSAVLFTLACAPRALRSAAVRGLLGLAIGFSVFCLDVYMVDLAPHWSQTALIERYYAERKSAKEPLLAWQMNWKGENFYTGNRVFVFVDLDNKALLDWIGKHKDQRVFFVLEHSRLDRLKRLLAPHVVEELTNMRDCNKFLLVRTTL